MGTDWLQLYDKSRSDKILAMNRQGLTFDFCFGEEWIYLDYWGCYAHVFNEGDPKGSIQSDRYLPNREDYGFLLLNTDHAERIIKSLKEHADDLRVMTTGGIERVEYFRDFCRGHPGYWVAYQFDY